MAPLRNAVDPGCYAQGNKHGHPGQDFSGSPTRLALVRLTAFTDANPQDNPGGTDVIEWWDEAFVRLKPDYSVYPDYHIYHTTIEELGTSLLNDYSK